jgi:hypothetical protein
VASKFEKHHVSRLPHPPYFPNINPGDFGLFGMAKDVLKDCEFSSRDEIEEAITKVWDDGQTVFHNWRSPPAWVIENGGEYIIE